MLKIIRELQAIAQTGLAYTDGKYDRERYERLMALTAVIAAQKTDGSLPEIRGLFTHIYKIFFLCDILDGEATTSMETSEVRFFGEDEIPADLSISRVLLGQIKLCFEHYRNPDLPTVFD